MISNDKPQNVIIVMTIIIALMSSISLMSSASYYGGSIVLAQNIDVSLVAVNVVNPEPSNETNPSLSFVFNFRALQTANGEATLVFMQAEIYLNQQKFNYSSFSRNFPSADNTVVPGFNMNFSLGATIREPIDAQIIYDAFATDTWTFSIVFHFSYHVFDARADSRRTMVFTWP